MRTNLSIIIPNQTRNMSHAKKAYLTDKAPKPFGAYSQAIEGPEPGRTVYLAGQIPFDVNTGKTVTSSIEAQADQTFKNVKAVCEAAGGSLDDIVKLTIFITDFKYFPAINKTMEKWFKQPYPARSTVGTSLGMGVDVEVEGIMVIPKEKSKI